MEEDGSCGFWEFPKLIQVHIFESNDPDQTVSTAQITQIHFLFSQNIFFNFLTFKNHNK